MNYILRIAMLTAAMSLTAVQATAQTGPYQFFALTPCRVVDTRGAIATNGGPGLGTAVRNFAIRGNCGVPTGAKAVSINVTVTNATNGSWLTLWPSGLAQPFVSTINFDSATTALANGAIVGVSTSTNDLSVRNAIGSVHVIIDVTGYYQ